MISFNSLSSLSSSPYPPCWYTSEVLFKINRSPKRMKVPDSLCICEVVLIVRFPSETKKELPPCVREGRIVQIQLEGFPFIPPGPCLCDGRPTLHRLRRGRCWTWRARGSGEHRLDLAAIRKQFVKESRHHQHALATSNRFDHNLFYHRREVQKPSARFEG